MTNAHSRERCIYIYIKALHSLPKPYRPGFFKSVKAAVEEEANPGDWEQVLQIIKDEVADSWNAIEEAQDDAMASRREVTFFYTPSCSEGECWGSGCAECSFR